LSSSTERPAAALEAHDPLAPLSDIRCTVDVVIGTGVLTLRDCLTLQRQQVVKLAEPRAATCRFASRRDHGDRGSGGGG